MIVIESASDPKLDADWSGPPRADRVQAADWTGDGAWWSSNCRGLM